MLIVLSVAKVLLRKYCCSQIYISSTKRICSNRFPKHSACSVPFLTQFGLFSAEILNEVFYFEYAPTRGVELATPRHTVAGWKLHYLYSIALPNQNLFATGLYCLIGFSLIGVSLCDVIIIAILWWPIAVSAIGIPQRNKHWCSILATYLLLYRNSYYHAPSESYPPMHSIP